MTTTPVWVLKSVVLAMHDAQLVEHGGPAGLRDEGLLDSALARPVNLRAYGDASLFDLAAAYAFGLVRNHPFIDANKRTAFLTTYVFLRLNGIRLTADEVDASTAMLALAAGETSEGEFAKWLAEHSRSEG